MIINPKISFSQKRLSFSIGSALAFLNLICGNFRSAFFKQKGNTCHYLLTSSFYLGLLASTATDWWVSLINSPTSVVRFYFNLRERATNVSSRRRTANGFYLCETCSW